LKILQTTDDDGRQMMTIDNIHYPSGYANLNTKQFIHG